MQWELVYDTNGFGSIYEPTGEQEPQLLEDLFTMHVHDHQQHGLVIRTKTQAVTVAELRTNFDSVSMTVTFGRNKKIGSLSGAHLKWPRGAGCAVLISLKDVYTVLGLQQFGGQSWRWINSGFKHGWAGWPKLGTLLMWCHHISRQRFELVM